MKNNTDKQSVFSVSYITPLFSSFLVLSMIAIATMAIAAPSKEIVNSPDWLQIFLGLFGGLALFLSGLQLLSEGMTKAAGQTLKTVLAKLTTNRLKGVLTGAFVTGVLNSSTVTTLLVVGFISGGMMTLTQSVGVIMGANIGSTVTAQLLAFNLSAYSLGPVALGFFMLFTSKQEKIKYYGMMIMGIGLVFYGMGLMSDTMVPLRSYEPFLEILKSLENPIAGIVAGAVFTAVVQSSAATVGIAIAMASEGLLALPAGIALALGANIGTAITTGLMGFLSSKSTDATRASVVHVTFNILGVLIWLPFIWLLVDISIWISPNSVELEGSARAAADVPRQIANANTFFNIINTLLFIGFSSWFARLAEKLIVAKDEQTGVNIEPEFLDKTALKVPAVALQQVHLELGRIGQITLSMMKDIIPALKEGDSEKLKNIAERDDEIDVLEKEILIYLSKIRKESLTEQESQELQDMMMATDNWESLADIIETDIIELARKSVQLNQQTSDETKAMLYTLYESTFKSVELAILATRNGDIAAAKSIFNMKDSIREQSEALLQRKAQRLNISEPEYLELVRLEMSFIDKMRRIYTLAKRIAKITLPEQ